MCIFTIKSVINYYTEQSTAVYARLLDARKAFDRVNQWLLFAKLIDTQALLLIVRVLLFWYFGIFWDFGKMGKLLLTLLYC